jgi:hypothetical protein
MFAGHRAANMSNMRSTSFRTPLSDNSQFEVDTGNKSLNSTRERVLFTLLFTLALDALVLLDSFEGVNAGLPDFGG